MSGEKCQNCNEDNSCPIVRRARRRAATPTFYRAVSTTTKGTAMKKKLATIAVAIALLSATGCTQADRVSSNVSKDAENFKVTRRLAVINTITDKPQLELVGNFSIEVDAEADQLEVTVDMGDGKFKKHFVGLTPTVTYIVEDISGADVSSTRYQISYLPEAIIPVEFKAGK